MELNSTIQRIFAGFALPWKLHVKKTTTLSKK